MLIFWKKKAVKIASRSGNAPRYRLPSAAGGSAPRLPRWYSHLLLELCPAVSIAKCVLYHQTITTVNFLLLFLPHFLHLIFFSNSVVFVDGGGGRKCFLSQGSEYPVP